MSLITLLFIHSTAMHLSNTVVVSIEWVQLYCYLWDESIRFNCLSPSVYFLIIAAYISDSVAYTSIRLCRFLFGVDCGQSLFLSCLCLVISLSYLLYIVTVPFYWFQLIVEIILPICLYSLFLITNGIEMVYHSQHWLEMGKGVLFTVSLLGQAYGLCSCG